MAGQIFLVLKSNQLLYLPDTCLALKKKNFICKATLRPPPLLQLLGQQKTYSPGLSPSFPLCLSSCKFLHLRMQIVPLKPLSAAASWWRWEKNDGFVGDGTHKRKDAKRCLCYVILCNSIWCKSSKLLRNFLP